MSGYVGIDFACNDADNGVFAGRVDQLQLYDRDGDTVFELEQRRDGPGPRFHEDGGSIRLSGKRWPVVGSRDWVGNWCWNRYVFQREVAADFLIWLHRRGAFNLSCGDERLFAAWKGDDLAPFRPFLLERLAKCRA